jgi:pyruvate formate lyase activating enzyme
MDAADPPTLRDRLAAYTAPGSLSEQLADGWVRCVACGHRCRIPPGRDGVCKVRFNRDGVLRVPHGYVSGLAVDPIEKKPFFHVLPGSGALSFGMLGCDYHCGYCQNWLTSQTLRDPLAAAGLEPITAARIVDCALRHSVPVITSTYNEPLITSEWAAEVFRLASRHGILCSYVSNGNATPEVLDFLRPWVRLFKIDLKSFRQRNYSALGGTLQTVLDTIRGVHGMGMWVEVVTLVVPGFNDDEGELRAIAEFLCSVSPSIPWHVTAFHPDYTMTAPGSTPPLTLQRAASIGRAAGLRYVYAGNVPGRTGTLEDTLCPGCGAALIERRGFRVIANRLAGGACPGCGEPIPGVWTAPSPAGGIR